MKRGRTAPKHKVATKRRKTLYVENRTLTRIVPERKYFDSLRNGISLLASTTSWAGAELDPTTLLTLFAPVLGDDIFNRQARKVQVLAIKIQGQIGVPPQAAAAGADVASIIRFHLVQDCQTNGAAALPQNVFGATNGNGEPTDMFQNPAFFGRFKVLKSIKLVMQNPNIANTSQLGTSLVQQGLAHIWKMSVKFKKPVVVHFNTTNGGTVADIVDNSFHVMGLTNDADLGALIAYRCRTTFVDL